LQPPIGKPNRQRPLIHKPIADVMLPGSTLYENLLWFAGGLDQDFHLNKNGWLVV
jgi:hypothetical protein